jgi:MATE family multidrug resistance protein
MVNTSGKGKYSKVDNEKDVEDSPRWVAAAQSPRSDSMYAPKAEEQTKQQQREQKEKAEMGSGSVCDELKNLWRVAWPTAISTMLRSGTQQVTVMLVGHIGAAELGAVALGTMWVNISGLSIVFGGMGALDTLCSQAYGARNYKLVGLWAQRGLLIIACLCVPIFFLWFFGTMPILLLLGIEESTAEKSQEFTRIQTLWMLPIFLNRVIQTYWRAQRVVKPYKNATICAFILHVPVAWVLTENFGFTGAAWALPINQWLLFGICLTIDKCQGISEKCWPAWSRQSFVGWGPLLRLGGAGTLTTMVRVEPLIRSTAPCACLPQCCPPKLRESGV